MTGRTPFELAVVAAFDSLRWAELDVETVREALVAAAHATVGADVDLAGLSAEQTYALGVATGRLVTDAEERARRQMPAGYSVALDEIYRHREGAACEARVIDGVLRYASLPKAAREMLEQVRARLAGQATGRVDGLYVGHRSATRKALLEALGASTSLTREQWEADVEAREAHR